jgi:hypothetical protein
MKEYIIGAKTVKRNIAPGAGAAMAFFRKAVKAASPCSIGVPRRPYAVSSAWLFARVTP